MPKNCVGCGKLLTDHDDEPSELCFECRNAQALQAVPEDCRICLMCHCRRHVRVLATKVSRSIEGLEWFECDDHAPTDNIGEVMRVSTEPMQQWILRNLKKPPPTVNKASDHIEPGALCCKCHKEPATFATRLVTRDDTMPFDALLWGGATCWDCAKTMARRLDIGVVDDEFFTRANHQLDEEIAKDPDGFFRAMTGQEPTKPGNVRLTSHLPTKEKAMRVQLQPTNQVVTVNGKLKGRVWHGTTDNGVPVQAVLIRIACGVEHQEENERLAQHLQECTEPCPEPRAFDMRFIL